MNKIVATPNYVEQMERDADHTWTCEALTIVDVLPHRLELWKLAVVMRSRGRDQVQVSERVGYRFYTGDRLIFEGVDFFTPLGMTRDMRRVAGELLCFLTLREGDTDADYFDDYTPAQLAWRDYYAEDLSAEVSAQMDGMTS